MVQSTQQQAHSTPLGRVTEHVQTGRKQVCMHVCCPVSSFSLHGRGRVGDAASAERSEQTHLRDLCLNAV